MPFIWRNKHSLPPPSFAGDALACLDSAYLLLDDGEALPSPQLHLTLGIEAEPSWESICSAFKQESAARLSGLCDALTKGQLPPPITLVTAQGKTLLARGHLVPNKVAHAVIWLHDITAEARKQERTHTEAEKLKSEIKLYSTILNMVPFPVWQRDKELDVRFYNLAYGELVEESAEQGGTPELDRRARQQARQAMQSGEAKLDRRHIISAGQRLMMEVSEIPVPGENMVIGCAKDISEVERLQEELQRYISAQGDLLESSASAMAIYGADMRMRSYNYAFARLWGLDEAWLDASPTYSEILESLREKRALPEQANFVLFKQQQLKLFTGLIEPHEEFFYLPDGRALRVIAIPHALGGILFAYEDVTDRLALERSYNTLIAVQRETLDNLHEGIAVFGENGRLRLSNPIYLSLWGLDKKVADAEPHVSDIVDRCRSLYVHEDWDALRARLIAQAQSRRAEVGRLELTNGKFIDYSTVPLPDGATLINYIDVTDSVRVEQSLRERNEALTEADRLKSEFLANVSYELRSPLTTIGGFAEMLSEQYFGGLTPKQKEYVDGIHAASQHLMQLVNDILDLASIEAGYMQLEITRFDIHAMMKAVLSLASERSRELDVEVKLACPAKIGKLLADETRIKQMLFKLLSNALKFSPPGGTVTLGAHEHGENMVALWVEDEGHGIPPEEQEAVFQKFYKGARSGKSAAPSGTGLGLSIVKSFTELHGGEAQLTSEPGQGTRITCLLPRENEALLAFLKKPARKPRVAKDKNAE